MNQTKKSVTFLVLSALVIVAGYTIWNNNKFASQTNSSQPQEFSSTEKLINENEYAGVTSINKDRKYTYTSKRYNFKFTYPSGWWVSDNRLGYGTLQILNYDISKANGGSIFPKGHNKIEATISSSNTYGISSDYPEKIRERREVIVAGQSGFRSEIELTGGEKILSYAIALPSNPNQYFSITIYGDPLNFYILDDLIKSIEWLN